MSDSKYQNAAHKTFDMQESIQVVSANSTSAPIDAWVRKMFARSQSIGPLCVQSIVSGTPQTVANCINLPTQQQRLNTL